MEFKNLLIIMGIAIFLLPKECLSQAENIFPTSGSVGIGTTSPQKALHIYGPYTNSLYLDSGADDGGKIFTGYDAGSAVLNFQEYDDPFILKFIQTAGPFENSLNFSNGFFGIGVRQPKDIFHIAGVNPVLRLSSNNYYGGNGGARNQIISSIKFVNTDANEAYRSEIRGVLTGSWATDMGIAFTTHSGGIQKERVRITHNGFLGVNTDTPDEALTVKGKIHTQEVRVDLNGAVAPDYVFNKDYKLLDLKEVKTYIEKQGHLPNIPSASEMEKNGVELKTMNLKLLEKIEELTLYIIELNKKLDNSNLEITELRKSYNSLLENE